MFKQLGHVNPSYLDALLNIHFLVSIKFSANFVPPIILGSGKDFPAFSFEHEKWKGNDT